MNHQRNIDTIRILAADMVETANSGHPGMPLGAAPMAYTLWTRHMKFNPANPGWINRDRFVLSAGHGSALLYALLHLFEYPGMTMEELRTFRQIGSLTPGHPEYGLTDGVEVTTGPLGQGISNAVGIALAERHLAVKFNRDGFPVIDFHTYVIASDGDLMEGISSEACSLAGHLGLDRLIVLYDDNNISIDGSTELAFTEDVTQRYSSYGWNVVDVNDGNDIEGIDRALTQCKRSKSGPCLIRVKTVIGYGAPTKAGTPFVHGSPLGADELTEVKKFYGFDPEQSFVIEDDVRQEFSAIAAPGAELEHEYEKLIERYHAEHKELAETFDLWRSGRFPDNWKNLFPTFETGTSTATRAASGDVLDAIAPHIWQMIGGSADLSPSNKTQFKGSTHITEENYGVRYIHYGVREHAMGAIMNGMAVTGLIPYGGTFLTFSDYMRPTIRLAALSGYGSIFVFTHDSVALGEDGPTHQPIEHYAVLRAIPNLRFIRPADANETAYAWQAAIEHREGPTALSLTRQNLPTLPGTENGGLLRGAYPLIDTDNPDLILVATGSEVRLAVEASATLKDEGYSVGVVSMPCWELFEMESDEYREEIFPTDVPVLGVESGISMGWERYTDYFIGIDRFGMSGPGDEVMKELGINLENILTTAREMIAYYAAEPTE